jgi:hypothetical protein
VSGSCNRRQRPEELADAFKRDVEDNAPEVREPALQATHGVDAYPLFLALAERMGE